MVADGFEPLALFGIELVAVGFLSGKPGCEALIDLVAIGREFAFLMECEAD